MPSVKQKVLSIVAIPIVLWVASTFFGWGKSDKIEDLFLQTAVNPYNGTYSYDINQITNPKILDSVTTQRKNGYSPLTLIIDNSGASLLGYQLNSAVKSRFFTACLVKDNLILASGDIGVSSADYCKTPANSAYSLQLKLIAEDTLLCINCEEYDYPSHWLKTQSQLQ